MADARSETTIRGSTTEPDTPDSQCEPIPLSDYIFARLIPTNRPAREGIRETAENGSAYHKSFISKTHFRDENQLCYEISLRNLPHYNTWRIGKGCNNQPNHLVDFRLSVTNSDDVADSHARFAWVKGAAGFFLIADNARGSMCTINGDDFTDDRRTIPLNNTITLGECAFTLQYAFRETQMDDLFQAELNSFLKTYSGNNNPTILPGLPEVDLRFGEWAVQHPISKGARGTVFKVTSTSGDTVAAKQLVMTVRNARKIEKEIAVARRISNISHPSIASPVEIRQNRCSNEAEIARIKTLLGNDWDPKIQGSIAEEYVVFSPFVSATFRSLVTSTSPVPNLQVFFLNFLTGVEHLHSHGLYHCDIKPSNILIRSCAPPEAMLCNFGCASDKPEMDYDVSWTDAYLAPEQKHGHEYGPAVDYWACGLVGCELLTGGTINVRIKEETRLRAYHCRLDQIGSNMAMCCKGMLAIDPASRMSVADAVETLKTSIKGTEENCNMRNTKRMRMTS